MLIRTQNTVSCSTNSNNVIYTKTRNPPYTNDVDWVRWRPTIPATGQYQVFVYMPGYTHTTGITTKARYQIGSATGTTTVVLNQNSGTCGWVSLGWYQFNAGTSGSVYMGDYTGDNPFQLIAADGVKFVANQPPLVPTMLSPSDGATTSSTNVTLQAQDAGDPDNGPSNSRQFQFAIEQIGGSWSQTSGWGGNSWNITLPADGQYRWHVQANDGSSSTSGWSVWRSITLSRVYSISGRITTSSGAGLGSVSVSDGTRTATTNSTGDYTLSGVPAGSYTLTPSRSGYSFSPTTRSISVSGNLTGQNFTGTLLTYSVSGRITTSSGTAISGVTVSDGTRTATTNSTGDYTLSGVPAGSYTLTPTKSGYSFSPTSLSVSVSSNLSNQNFTGTLLTYSVSGRITTSSGTAISGVTVSDGTRSATTDSNGNYTLTGVPPGNYTLTTSRSGYSFSPTTRSISVSGNLTGQNFTGTLLTYSVSGRITTSSGTAISGVTVSDGTRTATTNSTGDYTLTGVPAGSYTLTPSRSGYSFSPTTRSINVSGNLTDQGFTGTARARWTFMLYLDGDTQELDNGLVFGYFADAIQRLEVNPNDLVHVVALLDGTTTIDTFQVTFTPQAQYQPLGEKRMDDPLTLSAFVQQAQQEFPAEYYYLVIADHGNAIQGLAWDTTSANDKTALLTPGELRQALITITNDGAYPLDVVHFDACSFGLLETVAMARGMARYVVVSQNTAFASFPYERYRDAVGNNTTPQEFVRAITVAYAASISTPYTISALDMSQFEVVLSRLNTFADRLTAFANVSQANRDLLVSLRTQSQKFDSGGEPYLTITNDDKYIDLVDFATRTRTQVVTHDVPAAATTLIDAIQSFVIAEMHRSGIYAPDSYLSREWNLDGTHGISIYYPPRSAGSEFSDYIDGTTFPSFTSLSRWKNYLMVGAPPLAPGDPLPEDQIEPLAPLPVSPYNVYLPIVVR